MYEITVSQPGAPLGDDQQETWERAQLDWLDPALPAISDLAERLRQGGKLALAPFVPEQPIACRIDEVGAIQSRGAVDLVGLPRTMRIQRRVRGVTLALDVTTTTNDHAGLIAFADDVVEICSSAVEGSVGHIRPIARDFDGRQASLSGHQLRWVDARMFASISGRVRARGDRVDGYELVDECEGGYVAADREGRLVYIAVDDRTPPTSALEARAAIRHPRVPEWIGTLADPQALVYAYVDAVRLEQVAAAPLLADVAARIVADFAVVIDEVGAWQDVNLRRCALDVEGQCWLFPRVHVEARGGLASLTRRGDLVRLSSPEALKRGQHDARGAVYALGRLYARVIAGAEAFSALSLCDALDRTMKGTPPVPVPLPETARPVITRACERSRSQVV